MTSRSEPQRYIDAQGREWDTAEEALAEFVNELPALTDEEHENLFSATNHEWDAARNLQAIEYAATYHGLAGTVLGYYPIPHPKAEVTRNLMAAVYEPTTIEAMNDPGWRWTNAGFMMAQDVDWDMAHVPLFQEQRQAFNRRMLARSSHPSAHQLSKLRSKRVVYNPIDPKEARFID